MAGAGYTGFCCLSFNCPICLSCNLPKYIWKESLKWHSLSFWQGSLLFDIYIVVPMYMCLDWYQCHMNWASAVIFYQELPSACHIINHSHRSQHSESSATNNRRHNCCSQNEIGICNICVHIIGMLFVNMIQAVVGTIMFLFSSDMLKICWMSW